MKPSTNSALSSHPLSRRRFLARGAGAAAAFFAVQPHILGLRGATPPSQKLNIAGIGIGGQGFSDLRQMESENIVALCDVDWNHAARVFRRYPQAKQHKDYRRMLDTQKDIDAVVVATPDHTHAFASMRAIRLGKHVYCEKPLTHSVWEARQLALAAREHRVATQMGNQGQASEETRQLCEMVAAGAIGPVREAHIWTDRPSRGLLDEYWPQGVSRPADTPAVPDALEWDLWLGPAPARSYHPAYHPFKWRGWWDFGTGALGDIGCHAMDPVFRALQLGHPLTVEAVSSRVNDETYPLSSIVRYQFPARGDMPALALTWYDGGLRPARPDELEPEREFGSNGRLLVGDRGKILGTQIIPQAKAREFGVPPKTIPRSPGHYIEWINACKGGAPAGSHFDWAGPLAEVVLLGNIALRRALREELTRTKLHWDGPSLRVTNLEAANQYIRREYRPGWTL
ncbi:MAG TPA: Gfo/Idh/MocA family oxidoreductase [Candidatus Paceibacterota bacterium]|nr:Gfo/Idh/MocA family oxidoreductase [Verrucomicrobiota bacterium]HOX04163.1 Gfo/Idh/MocA family oxidoreductase [Verrucomicrobiota bacterium]HRZ47064.1 Gfo/Idh/MocA family oxidoreductase [Candidatus Paceibacterota bacterium]HRZ92795.1 Gfo/Idh/MocA family oxidoreductase [Candidatus Paceibacterota bacterium]